jgi:hypothetical protein
MPQQFRVSAAIMPRMAEVDLNYGNSNRLILRYKIRPASLGGWFVIGTSAFSRAPEFGNLQRFLDKKALTVPRAS